MRTQPHMCPLGSLCREHCQGHRPGRLVLPPRILLLMRAAGRCPQSNKKTGTDSDSPPDSCGAGLRRVSGGNQSTAPVFRLSFSLSLIWLNVGPGEPGESNLQVKNPHIIRLNVYLLLNSCKGYVKIILVKCFPWQKTRYK